MNKITIKSCILVDDGGWCGRVYWMTGHQRHGHATTKERWATEDGARAGAKRLMEIVEKELGVRSIDVRKFTVHSGVAVGR